MSIAALEGQLTVRLGARGAVLSSTAPLRVARLFAGRGTREVLTLLPQLYAVCGRAHLAAAAGAMEAARGHAPHPRQQRARTMVVDAEALREHLLRVLLGWGKVLEQRVHPVVLSDVMGLPERLSGALGQEWSIFAAAGSRQPEFGETAAALESVDTLLEQQVLGCRPTAWLELAGVDEVLAMAGSRAFGPRFLRWLLDNDHAASGAAMLPALPGFTPGWLARRFGGDAPATHPAPAPEWDGTPCETGAYARQRAQPLVQAFSARWGHGLIARSVARLTEIALLATRLHGAASNAIAAIGAPGEDATGYGIVETARGRLAHSVTLRGEVVTGMQILAPTDWNCHPRGVMAACLDTLPLDARSRERAALVVECIDPCVGYTVELEHDA